MSEYKREHAAAIRGYGKAIALAPGFGAAYHKAWADVKECQRLGGKVNPKFLTLLRKASGRKE